MKSAARVLNGDVFLRVFNRYLEIKPKGAARAIAPLEQKKIKINNFQFLAHKGAVGPALSMGVCGFQFLAPKRKL